MKKNIDNKFTRENAAEWADLDHVFCVEECRLDGYGEISAEAFRTLDEANEFAEYRWAHLTPGEQKQKSVCVYRVEHDSLNKELYSDEDMPIDWKAYDSLDFAEGGFDSEEVKRLAKEAEEAELAALEAEYENA